MPIPRVAIKNLQTQTDFPSTANLYLLVTSLVLFSPPFALLSPWRTWEHIKSLCLPAMESHYARKDSNWKFLSSSLNICKMYDLYVKECQQKGKRAVKHHKYREIFCNEYNLSFHVPNKDQCINCNDDNTVYLTRSSLALSLIPKETSPFSITKGIDSKIVTWEFSFIVGLTYKIKCSCMDMIIFLCILFVFLFVSVLNQLHPISIYIVYISVLLVVFHMMNEG
jgi:hypothetical protein